ncbi:MAG: hypothetical protein K8T89_06460 [Planctomycetes bacterium]|nr:hypothetical protein [Planctomycetota bacterium]
MSQPIDPTATRILAEFKHASPLIGCRFDPSGRYLFVSAQDNTLQRYDLLNNRKTPLEGHTSWTRGLAFLSPNLKDAQAALAYENARVASMAVLGGRALILPSRPYPAFTLISADYHGKLVWWAGESDSPKPIRTVEAHDGWIRAVVVSPDGTTIATCGNDLTIKLWAAADGKHLKTLTGHESHVYNVAFHPDGQHLVSGDLKGIIKDWDLKKGSVVRELDAKVFTKYDPTFMADIGGVRSMTFSADGTQLACAGISNVSNAFAGIGNPLILLFDWKDGKAKQLKPKDAFQGTAWGVEFHPEGWVISTGGGAQGRVWFWKAGDLTSAHVVTVNSNSRDLSLHPDGTKFAVACADGTARVYTMLPKKT